MAKEKKFDETKKKDKKWLERHPVASVLLALLFVIVIIGAANGQSPSTPTTSTDQTTTVSASPTPTPTPTPAQPIHLTGIGQAASDKFTLKSGLATAKLTSTGDGHFGVWLLDNSGDKVELLANDSGQPFNGSKAFQVPSDGQYLLDVEADSGAAWTVDITQ